MPGRNTKRRASSGSEGDSQKGPRKRAGRDLGTRSKTKQRRLRQDDDNGKPEEELFVGKVFFMLPAKYNSKVTQAQIKAFRQNGAKVIDNFAPDSVTHLLVTSKQWTENKVLEYLGLEEFPKGLKVVRDKWAHDCIEKGQLIDESIYHLREDDNGKLMSESSAESQEAKNDENVEEDKVEVGSDGDEVDEDVEREEEENELDSAIKNHQLQMQAEGLLTDEEEDQEEEQSEIEEPSDIDQGRGRKGRVKGDWAAVLTKDKAKEYANNPNKKVIKLFSIMSEHYKFIGDDFRAIAYRKAIATLKSQSKKIKTAEEARKLPGFGERLANKLEEIVKTGRLKRLEDAKDEKIDSTIKMLTGIYGVGPTTAQKWYSEGVRKLEDVAKRDDLNEGQRFGLEHYDDFNERIPRHIVEKHYAVIKEAIHHVGPDIEVYCTGSYRRGQKDSGDIDVIFTKKDKDAEYMGKVHQKVLDRLREIGYIKCTLSGDKRKWLGAGAIEGDPKWRRVDILPVPWSEIGARLIYYTGDDIFNRSMRLLALAKGYHLNGNGLYSNPQRKRDMRNPPKSDLVEGTSERRIFEILGVPYREPTDRIVG